MNLHAAANPRPDRREKDAFTFTDLLVVLGVVTVLGLLSVTALAHNQPASDRAGCTNNLRRLMQGWQMYADDNSGRLMPNSADYPGRAWVSGWLDYFPSNRDNTNTFILTNAAYAEIGPYVSSSSWFRCPADLATLVFGTRPALRVRSYSMNGYVGPTLSVWSPSFQVMTKMPEVSQPDRIFVFTEEHPDSINDPVFLCDPASVGANAKIIDYPGHFHLGGANLSMADGHSEYWQWADARTMPPVMNNNNLPLNVGSPNNPDVARLQAAASYLR